MTNRTTSLPGEITTEIKKGDKLAGDDLDEVALRLWYQQEQEAFFEGSSASASDDPWYRYMRYVNERLGFAFVERSKVRVRSLLVLGPGGGEEVQGFTKRHPECRVTFVEASQGFRTTLKKRFPKSTVIEAEPLGTIPCDDESMTLITAFSVLHHVAHVSKILRERARILERGGLLLVREPCSSMGDWRLPRSATPNERGIPRKWMISACGAAGLVVERKPVPVLFEPLNKLLKRTIGFGAVPFSVLYVMDRGLSALVAANDHYWRDSLLKKIGPSSYFYVFRKS